MPEGPELFLNATHVSTVCHDKKFGGPIVKARRNRSPNINWHSTKYTIEAISRGKEMKLVVKDISREKKPDLFILFHFAKTGNFRLTSIKEVPRCSQLRFSTYDNKEVLSFVDSCGLGQWFVNKDWQVSRGPCFITEHALFRQHIERSLRDKAFNGPICEVLLNQRFFNGVGNYIRAEVLFRCRIKPFDPASEVLQRGKDGVDLLDALKVFAEQVINIGGENGYYCGGLDSFDEISSILKCYGKKGMICEKDVKTKNIWYEGERGSCPKTGKRKGSEFGLIDGCVKLPHNTFSSKVILTSLSLQG